MNHNRLQFYFENEWFTINNNNDIIYSGQLCEPQRLLRVDEHLKVEKFLKQLKRKEKLKVIIDE